MRISQHLAAGLLAGSRLLRPALRALGSRGPQGSPSSCGSSRESASVQVSHPRDQKLSHAGLGKIPKIVPATLSQTQLEK